MNHKIPKNVKDESSLRNVNDDIDVLSKKGDITNYLPPELFNQLDKIDKIIQTDIDTIVTANLSVLASLSSGTTVFDSLEDESGTVIIIYSAGFFKSGGGKTAAVRANQKYFLDWREKELCKLDKDQNETRAQIEIELKCLGKSSVDNATRQELESKLLDLRPLPDVFLEDATAEGFELSIACGSTPVLYLDNFGIYLASSKKNEHKASFIRMLDNIFDNGRVTTRRLKSDNRRATQLHIKGLGAHFSSTIGDSNLKPKDLKDNIENGFFNKVLITFQDKVSKPIPLKSSLNNIEKNEIEVFSRAYHAMASECDFYLSEEAFEVYKVFHDSISDEYMRRYNNDEDLAGLIIRLLKISKRIACIFEIATGCQKYRLEGSVDVNEGIRRKEPISTENMQRAINMLNYLKEEHTSKLLHSTQSDSSKSNPIEIVLNKINSLHGKGRGTTARDISMLLSDNQRKLIRDIPALLRSLVNSGKLELNDGNYFDKG